MRAMLAALSLSSLGLLAVPAHADPYLWCSVNGSNQQLCVFKTLESCRKATPEAGCVPNMSYSRKDTQGYGRRHHALRY